MRFNSKSDPRRALAILDDEDVGDDIFDLKGTTKSHNRLYFYRDVSHQAAADFVRSLRETATDIQQRAIAIGVEDLPPIHLHIHSEGGEVFSGLAILDAILNCPVSVHTHIDGSAASAATLFSVAGRHRTIGQHSFVLIHQLSSGFWGKYEEFKDEMANNTALMRTIKRIYSERTKMPKRRISELLKRDLWLDARTALDYGLVDEIRS